MQGYLQTVYELAQENEGVRITDIAIKRQKTAPSVCVAMRTLQAEGLIRRGKNHLVFLTRSGYERAAISMGKYVTIYRYLVDIMGISHENAAADARAMEHTISLETLCSMCRWQNDAEAQWRNKTNCLTGT